jgi:hypothetical protein
MPLRPGPAALVVGNHKDRPFKWVGGKGEVGKEVMNSWLTGK